MVDTRTVIEQAYHAFNSRDVAGALALMTADVSWPKASEGGRVNGPAEVRAYWSRQWSEFDPHVEPLEFEVHDGHAVRVRARQVVRDRKGQVLFDGEVVHVFTLRAGLIASMTVADQPADGRSVAFAHRG